MPRRSPAPAAYILCCLLLGVFAASAFPAPTGRRVLVPSGTEIEAHHPDEQPVFTDLVETWGTGVEAEIERAYRDCFRTYVVDGEVMTVRMPFAQNNEREELAGTELEIFGKGKGDPAALWREIDTMLASADFARYLEVLSDGREKVIEFDLPGRRWTVNTRFFDIAGMKVGAYRGLPHRPFVLSTGKGAQETDVYNYLYCVGRIGMDCSGFVWHVLSETAKAGGVDLHAILSRANGVPRGIDPSLYVGTVFFDSKNREVVPVDDEIGKLRPGDVILFRSHDGSAAHSAVIQSIDYTRGLVRYLQSTDEAPPDERGVHDSYIRFDPAAPGTSLKDPSLDWTQSRYPPFQGERPSAFSNDGERYRAYPDLGGGKVVRLKAMDAAIRNLTTEPVR